MPIHPSSEVSPYFLLQHMFIPKVIIYKGNGIATSDLDQTSSTSWCWVEAQSLGKNVAHLYVNELGALCSEQAEKLLVGGQPPCTVEH